MPTATLTAPDAPEPNRQDADLLAVALAAAARGWHVFPTIPNRKEPAVKAWEARATTDLPDPLYRPTGEPDLATAQAAVTAVCGQLNAHLADILAALA